MWQGSVHFPELSTEPGKQSSRPTPGSSPEWQLRRPTASVQTADRFRNDRSHGAAKERGPCWVKRNRPCPANADLGSASNVSHRSETCSSAIHHQHRRNCHRSARSQCKQRGAMRNHMSRGQRTSQPAKEAQIVGPGRACSVFIVNESSGRPVAEPDCRSPST